MSIFIGNKGVSKEIVSIYIGVDSVAKNVVTGYIGDGNGKAKIFFGGKTYELSYTGAHIINEVIYNNIRWEQWTFLGNGVLKIKKGIIPPSQIWMISGGGAGEYITGANVNAGTGGLGGYSRQASVVIADDTIVTIGAGGTTAFSKSGGTSFGSIQVEGVSNVNSIFTQNQGGTGNGQGKTTQPAGLGDGVSKYPFGDQINFVGKPHGAAGGGGGCYNPSRSALFKGGNGGTNGGNGGSIANVSGKAESVGGTGGLFGGGNGGSASLMAGYTSGFFYGAGGGGAGFDGITRQNSGGSGYQGVVYLRIPIGSV